MKPDYTNDRGVAWGYGNTVLYRMCLCDAPKHIDPDEIHGKTWLIGRTYAASPERGAGEPAPGQDPDFFRHLAKSSRWKEIDAALNALSDENAFSTKTLSPVLDTHALLVDLIRERTAERLSAGTRPRGHTSFASKYLHFHRPNHFPIFDSYVSEAISREYPRARYAAKSQVDERYARFCAMALRYLEEHSEITSLRSLDRHLYERQRTYRQEHKFGKAVQGQ